MPQFFFVLAIFKHPVLGILRPARDWEILNCIKLRNGLEYIN
jgi:hypothetical protein